MAAGKKVAMPRSCGRRARRQSGFAEGAQAAAGRLHAF